METEAKYSLTTHQVPEPEELVAALSAVGLGAGPLKTVVQKDRYYDDARLSLSRAGYAVRRRMADGELLATLKTLGVVQGAVHRREELELPIEVANDALNPWPQPIADRIRTVTDPRALRSTMEFVIERTSFTVLQDGRPAAVVAFDDVAARRVQSDRSAHWNELEIEVLDDEREPGGVLEAAAEAIGTLIDLVPSSQTKLERAQALLLLGAALDGDDDEKEVSA